MEQRKSNGSQNDTHITLLAVGCVLEWQRVPEGIRSIQAYMGQLTCTYVPAVKLKNRPIFDMIW